MVGTVYSSLVEGSTLVSEVRATETIFEKLAPAENQEQGEDWQHLLTFTDSIEVKELCYAYNEDFKLHFPNLHFNKGGKYAVVGESGSGKSTLLNVLSGNFEDYQGNILIDGCPKRDFSNNQYRELLTYIFQSPYLFNLTIRDNVSLGEDYSDEEIKVALVKSGFSHDLNEFPEGLDTIIKENGKNLSGGQVQRVTIARGLIRNKALLIMDEVTSNLDKQTALRIEKNVLQDRDLTIIMVTHHLREETLTLFDEIYQIQG